MKKLFVMLVMATLSMNLMAGELVIKAGIDINSDTEMENNMGFINEKKNSSNTVHLGVEVYGQFSNAIYLGAGIEFPNKLEIENGDFETLKVVPVYLTGKIKSIQNGVKPYIGAKLGAAVPFYEDDIFDEYSAAGLFLGVNAGLEFESNLMAEIFYEQSEYGVENSDNGKEINFTTPKVGVNVGYKFDL